MPDFRIPDIRHLPIRSSFSSLASFRLRLQDWILCPQMARRGRLSTTTRQPMLYLYEREREIKREKEIKRKREIEDCMANRVGLVVVTFSGDLFI